MWVAPAALVALVAEAAEAGEAGEALMVAATSSPLVSSVSDPLTS